MDSGKQPSLHVIDYIVFAAMFALTMAIGIRYAVGRQRSKSREAYFVAERKMHFVPVALSLVATFSSSIAMLGHPAESYVYGLGALLSTVAVFVTQLLSVYIVVPLFKPLEVTSVYEYLQLRFHSRNLRLCGVALFLICQLFYLGVVLYAQAVAVETVMGINMWISVLVMDACAVIYTSLGGIKSVVWTDVFQACVMYVGVVAVIIKGTIDTGGMSKVWEHANSGNRLQVFNFDPDPTVRHTVWTTFLPFILVRFDEAFGQSTIQRISATKSLVGARRMMLLAAFVSFPLFLLVLWEGVVLYAYFRQWDAEPLSCGQITNPNQIVPYAVLILFEDLPGMAGLFIAALYSASLSTISSGLSSMSVLVTEDLFKPLLKNTSDARATIYAKISVVCLGAICLIFCAVATFVTGPVSQIANSLTAAASGPLLGLFFLACFFPSSNARGAAVGVVAGFIMSWTLSMGSTFHPNVRKTPWLPLGNGTCPDGTTFNATSIVVELTSGTTPSSAYNSTIANTEWSGQDYNEYFSLSYCLFSPIGIVSTIVVGLFTSYLAGRNRPGDVNPKYFLEVSDSLLVFLPPHVRRWLKGFGPQFKDGWKKTAAGNGELQHFDATTVCEEKL